MVKQKTQFFCNSCGYQAGKWLGRCPVCNGWNCFTEEIINNESTKYKFSTTTHNKPVLLRSVFFNSSERLDTGNKEFDKVLGGGIMPGSVILLGGDPGVGKSTLLMQVAMSLSLNERKILYVSGEESASQIKMRVNRFGKYGTGLFLYTTINIAEILLEVQQLSPQFMIIDSIQTIFDPDITSSPGSVSQIRECTAKLVRISKELNIAILIIGHITKDGQIAGPKLLEHMVDVVLYFEGEFNYNLRLLRVIKNRFGSINECGIFSMEESGLKEILNPSAILLSERINAHAGAIVTPFIEGNRPLLVEIQALATQSYYGMPRRLVAGFDYNRLIILLAILEKRIGINFGQTDIFINSVGGIKVNEPAADLAVTLAILSSYKDFIIGNDVVAFGEIGLTGEVRGVINVAERITEAEMLGFKTIILPKISIRKLKRKIKCELIEIDHIQRILDLV